jgi:hypothetical protein
MNVQLSSITCTCLPGCLLPQDGHLCTKTGTLRFAHSNCTCHVLLHTKWHQNGIRSSNKGLLLMTPHLRAAQAWNLHHLTVTGGTAIRYNLY